jgi:hypothetical protein
MNRHDDQSAQVWSLEAVRRLGLTTDIETAASVLGIGRTLPMSWPEPIGSRSGYYGTVGESWSR